ncbi:MAG: hypothetical protein OEZ01_00025 [Candidatus Heimdallarchaeota archaeon]|nr:hypothetical protein [Candidatus Heimdallarchaeota archaeon]
MKIERSTIQPIKAHKKKDRRAIIWPLIVLMSTCVLTYLITVQYLMPDYLQPIRQWAKERGLSREDWDGGDKGEILRTLVSIPKNVIKPLDLPRLVVDIKFNDLQILFKKREQALSEGILTRSEGDFVPASIRHGDKTTKVKLRLKGDFIEHLEGNKWSLRVHVRGKDHVSGMRRFSIQHPKTRGYQREILFFETLRHLDILAPRYYFAEVTASGNNIGIMAIEEHFSKELLESNARKESVIIKFDESLVWAARDGKVRGFEGVFDDFRNTRIDAFRSSQIAKSERLSKDYAIAVGLMRGFMEGNMSAADVFDSTAMGRFIAAAELWGAYHALRWHNMRFALNPITMKLEPIGFDASLSGNIKTDAIVSRDEPIIASILADPEISSIYLKTLKELAHDINKGELLNRLKRLEKELLEILRKEFFLLQPIGLDRLKERASFLVDQNLSELTKPIINGEQFPVLVHAYQGHDEDGSYLEVVNAVPYAVTIQGVRWDPKRDNPKIDFDTYSNVKFPLTLEARTDFLNPDTKRIYFKPPLQPEHYKLRVVANILSQKRTFDIKAQQYFSAKIKSPVPDSSIRNVVSKYDFLTVTKDREIAIRPGNWTINSLLIIPKGYSLKVSKGTTLVFSQNSGIISYGPIYFEGTPEVGIELRAITKNNSELTWQGIAVLNANTQSKLNYVKFYNLSCMKTNEWELTGGVTFYKSDIVMESVSINNATCEDALNIVHSDFMLKDLQIVKTASDAFDADFSDGKVIGGLFKDVGLKGGGDGVDISGSTVVVKGTRFDNVNDKALSVGEASNMIGTNIKMNNVGTGAASKDGSKLELSKTHIKGARNAALMAYIKKPEYGAAVIEALDVEVEESREVAITQKGSRITINGTDISGEDIDVKNLYKTIMKKGGAK